MRYLAKALALALSLALCAGTTLAEPHEPDIYAIFDGTEPGEVQDAARETSIAEWQGMIYYFRDVDGERTLCRRDIHGGAEEIFLTDAISMVPTPDVLYVGRNLGFDDIVTTGYNAAGEVVSECPDRFTAYWDGWGYGSVYYVYFRVDPNGGKREILYEGKTFETPVCQYFQGIHQGKAYFYCEMSIEGYDEGAHLFRVNAADGSDLEWVADLDYSANLRFHGGWAYGWLYNELWRIPLDGGLREHIAIEAVPVYPALLKELMYSETSSSGFFLRNKLFYVTEDGHVNALVPDAPDGELIAYAGPDSSIVVEHREGGYYQSIASPGEDEDGNPLLILPIDVVGASRFYYFISDRYGYNISFHSCDFLGGDDVCYWAETSGD